VKKITKIQDYDEEAVLARYILLNRELFMTLFEKRAEQLGIMREKARASIRESPEAPPAWTEEFLNQYEAQTDFAVQNAIGNDLQSFATFLKRISDRINAGFANGELLPNRCPSCKRIVKTPKACQCLWCGYDWHRTGQ
jgi:hypothetical protein